MSDHIGPQGRLLLGQTALWALLLGTSAGTAGATEPACAVLTAVRSSAMDTPRIQSALDRCNPGQSVVLRGGRFESAPLRLPRGVTLYLERGTTLYASRNPRDYDLQPGACGRPGQGKAAVCKPFLFAYQAAYSGVTGAGVIDGQGAGWTKSGTARVPDLISSYESQGFRIEGVTLRNAPDVHAAIYKTIGLAIAHVKVDSSGDRGAGLLLSNVVNATVSDVWVRGPAQGMVLQSSILGATSGVTVRDLHLFGAGITIGDDNYGGVQGVTFDRVFIDGARVGFYFNLSGRESGPARDIRLGKVCLHGVRESLRVEPAGRAVDFLVPDGACEAPGFAAAPEFSAVVDWTTVAAYGTASSLVVATDGTSEFRSIQKAVDALPSTGGDIRVKPGTYREVVTIRKPHVRLHGDAEDPAKTVIVYGNGAPTSGGTFNTATVFVEADDVTVDHLTIANDFGFGKGQAVALAVTADRALFRHLRLLAAQDTLFAASRYCYGDYGPCVAARQYFADCYIEGNVDFIFGDSKALFEGCELHGIDIGNVIYTAQSRHTAEQDSAYVFQNCRLTRAARAGVISLGRPWRPYARVVFHWLPRSTRCREYPSS